MTRFTLTVIDTSGIQNYVFNSNRLRENIGASHLVSEVTGDWVEETLEKLGVPKGGQEAAIEKSKLNAELVYAGGGNTIIIFKSRKIAVEFIQILSQKILRDAPGINLVVAHADFEWNHDTDNNLCQVVKELMQGEVERRKYERINSVPLLGLGVTAVCNSTQLPAIGRSDEFVDYRDEKEADSYLISTETRQKLAAVPRANKKLRDIFAEVVDQDIFQFPYRTDHLGRSEGESSYVAIIHADGNGMGKRFQKYGEDSENNRDYINRMRNFSKSVDVASKKALQAVAKILIKSIQEGKVIGKYGEFKLKAKYYLPFRPLVYGGDDITFICEGRLGLELAILFLKELEKQIVADDQNITACAGVCIVKTHYPFARAYQLSEDLCKEAKRFVKQNKEFSSNGFSAIDWHLAASGLIGSIEEIRKREYEIMVDKNAWKLAMRPLRLHNSNQDCRNWEGFKQVVQEFQTGENWQGRHNKIMALREVLREASSQAVEEFLLAYKLPHLPLFPESSGQTEQLKKSGWQNRVCGYFDAIEALDFYIGLED